MISSKRMAVCVGAAAAIAFGMPTTTFGAGDGSTAAVVVSSDLPVDGISFGDLKRLYMGSPIVAGGKKLVPLTYPKESPERLRFDKAVLGMSSDQVALYWIDRKIRGQPGAPKALDSAEVLINVVRKVDGTVGFVKASSMAPGVKVLKIDGKRPGDPGYPIRI